MGEASAQLERPGNRADADVALFRRDPRALRHLPLGRFTDAGVRDLLLRRTLLSLPLPQRTLDAWSVRGSAQSKLRMFAGELAYWRRAKSLLSRTEWATLTRGPVILMYHAIGAPGEPASRHVLPEPLFRRQMAWLRARGYRLTGLREIVGAREEGRLPEPRSVVVTLDDGYRDNAAALDRSGVPATVFVVTAAMGGRNDWDASSDLAGRPMLDWDEARQLLRAGVEIGGHTRTHPPLTDTPPARLLQEVSGSLEDLRRELGPGAYTFAYPHGRFDARVKAAVAGAGFVGACCSRGGINDPYVPETELRRVEIKGTDSFVSFMLMAWLGRRITPIQLIRSLLLG